MPTPRTPTKLRLLQGNPAKRPLPKNEPQPNPQMPDCPPHLNAEAKREWDRITKDLHAAGLLTKVDRAALAMYCAVWARWVEAETHLRKGGSIKMTPGGYPVVSPWLKQAHLLIPQMQKLLREFGMSPSSRSGIKAGEAPSAADPFEELLGS